MLEVAKGKTAWNYLNYGVRIWNWCSDEDFVGCFSNFCEDLLVVTRI